MRFVGEEYDHITITKNIGSTYLPNEIGSPDDARDCLNDNIDVDIKKHFAKQIIEAFGAIKTDSFSIPYEENGVTNYLTITRQEDKVRTQSLTEMFLKSYITIEDKDRKELLITFEKTLANMGLINEDMIAGVNKGRKKNGISMLLKVHKGI